MNVACVVSRQDFRQHVDGGAEREEEVVVCDSMLCWRGGCTEDVDAKQRDNEYVERQMGFRSLGGVFMSIGNVFLDLSRHLAHGYVVKAIMDC